MSDPQLLIRLKEMREVCACAARVIVAFDGATEAFVAELARCHIPDGFGKRAEEAIRAAEHEHEG